jgi:Na+-transporting methylmalonyl-CoA/oxaloacetate decarboxylase gamma subunit
MQETLQQNLPLALVGLLIVFMVQIIIALTISGIRQLDEKWRFQEKIDNAEAFDREPTVDATTVVLLSAAAATVLLGRFRIRSIRRLMPADHKRSPWSAQGRSRLQGSHSIERKNVRHR